MNKVLKGGLSLRIISGLVAVLLVMTFVGCSKKGGGGGGSKAAPASDFSYDLTADGSGIKITNYTGNGGVVVIPSKIEDMPVTEIGIRAFEGSRDDYDPNEKDAIISIVVPDSVVTIGENAFIRMRNLTKATLPKGLKVIQASTFASCKKLASVNLPSNLEEIGTSVFYGCSELSDLIIPDTIKSMKFLRHKDHSYSPPQEFGDGEAFVGCQKLPIKTRQRLQELGYKDKF